MGLGSRECASGAAANGASKGFRGERLADRGRGSRCSFGPRREVVGSTARAHPGRDRCRSRSSWIASADNHSRFAHRSTSSTSHPWTSPSPSRRSGPRDALVHAMHWSTRCTGPRGPTWTSASLHRVYRTLGEALSGAGLHPDPARVHTRWCAGALLFHNRCLFHARCE